MSEEAERTKNVRAEIRRQLEHGNVSVQWSGWVDATGLRSMIYVWGKKHNRKLSTHIVQDGELYTLTTTDRATATLPTVYSDITLVRALERGTLLQAAGETDYEALEAGRKGNAKPGLTSQIVGDWRFLTLVLPLGVSI
jgi:hypothetical protein